MNLIGQGVMHRDLGAGEIKEQTERTIEVLFSQGQKKFLFPDVFENFLTANDETIAGEIQAVLAEKAEERERLRLEKEELMERERLSPALSTTPTPRTSKPRKNRTNVVFRFTFCDGGATKTRMGFAGSCQEALLRQHVETEKVPSCSVKSGPCYRFVKGDIKRTELNRLGKAENFACSVNQLLVDWRVYTGLTASGPNKGTPTRINYVHENSLCVLTTLPGADKTEAERVIFGVFVVGEIFEGSEGVSGYIAPGNDYKIALTPQEAERLLYWNYFQAPESKTTTGPSWPASVPKRQCTDTISAQILRDIVELKRGTKQEDLAQRLFNYFCTLNNISVIDLPEPNGALRDGSSVADSN